MFVNAQEFLDFVNSKGGPNQLAMLVFNNSYVKVFGEGEFFNPTEHFDQTNGMFKFVEKDVKGREYHSYKFLDYLEGLTFAPPGVNKDTIYYRNYRP